MVIMFEKNNLREKHACDDILCYQVVHSYVDKHVVICVVNETKACKKTNVNTTKVK